MSKSIWIATSGSYSDYAINAVFEREEDAQAAVDDGFADIVEEHRLYAAGETPTKTHYWIAHNRPRTGSDPWEIHIEPRITFAEEPVVHEHGEYPVYPPERGLMCFWAKSLDRERAVKSVADRIFQHRSQEPEGPPA